jgi:hypothetical protein
MRPTADNLSYKFRSGHHPNCRIWAPIRLIRKISDLLAKRYSDSSFIVMAETTEHGVTFNKGAVHSKFSVLNIETHSCMMFVWKITMQTSFSLVVFYIFHIVLKKLFCSISLGAPIFLTNWSKDFYSSFLLGLWKRYILIPFLSKVKSFEFM